MSRRIMLYNVIKFAGKDVFSALWFIKPVNAQGAPLLWDPLKLRTQRCTFCALDC